MDEQYRTGLERTNHSVFYISSQKIPSLNIAQRQVKIDHTSTWPPFTGQRGYDTVRVKICLYLIIVLLASTVATLYSE